MDDMLATLRSQLLELKLKYLAAQLDDFMLTASCSDKPYAELLHDFLDVEIRERRAASMDKRLRMANLPTFDTPLDLEYFDFAKRTGVSKRQIIELTSHFRWIDKAYNILFFGGSGVGKTFLSSYIAYKAIESGYTAIFISLHDLTQLLKTEHLLSRSKTRLKHLRNCDLLIIDEIGSTALDREEGNKLFQLISDFYQQTSLLSQTKALRIGLKRLETMGVTAAIMDCLLHKCELFNIDGDSWRLENQQSILRDLLPMPAVQPEEKKERQRFCKK